MAQFLHNDPTFVAQVRRANEQIKAEDEAAAAEASPEPTETDQAEQQSQHAQN